jgi:outer membrane protein assembly factor BamD (BamD/ComL family)
VLPSAESPKQQAAASYAELSWEKTQEINTIDAYKAFLQKHKGSVFDHQAKTRLAELDWKKAQESDKIEDYQVFLQKYPTSEHRQLINVRIKALIEIREAERRKQAAQELDEWEATKQSNTLEAYRQFFSKRPESIYKESSEEMAKLFKQCKTAECSDYFYLLWDQAKWKETKATSHKEAYQQYLLLFPDGKHLSSAKEAVDDIDWQVCKNGQNKNSCETYLAVHKRGKHAKEAKEIITNIEFADVKQLNTIEGYEKFLKTHWDHKDALTGLRHRRYAIAVETGKLDNWLRFYDGSKVPSYKRRDLNKTEQSTYDQMMENAEKEIDRLLFEDITADHSLKSAKQYLKMFPKGNHKQQVLILMEPIFYKEANSLNTVSAYTEYLGLYPTGFSSEDARMLMDKALWAKTQKDNDHTSYSYYIKKHPNGLYSKEANEKIAWMKANPAKPKIDYPQVIVGSGSPPRFSWVTKFSEESGQIGYTVSGGGWVKDIAGRRYGPNGRKGSRGSVTVPPGGKAQDDHWVRGSTFCGGSIDYTWVGKDTNGHRITLSEIIRLTCKK